MRTPRSPNHAELGDPLCELVAVDHCVRIAQRFAPDRLGHTDDRVRQHLALLVGCGDLDQRGDRFRRRVEDLLDDARELGVGAQRRAEEEQERGPVADRESEIRAEPDLHPFPQ